MISKVYRSPAGVEQERTPTTSQVGSDPSPGEVRKIALRSRAWYGDGTCEFRVPAEWEVTSHWPATPPPLSDEQIESRLSRPVGLDSLDALFRGKRAPLIVVDDLYRPTPVGRILPFIFRRCESANLALSSVRILVATGTHGRPDYAAAALKVGRMAADQCELIVHDPMRHLERFGNTSFGTAVRASRYLRECDCVIGIGGIYPNQTAGFGGGSKLALGVLGVDTIRTLHYRHGAAGWGSISGECNFRRELDEIARMLGLRTLISIQVDANREVVRLACGDPILYFEREVQFALKAFSVPGPGDADVVIASAYPDDVTLTAAMIKGATPLLAAARSASRVLIAACPGGPGSHGLFPAVNHPRFHRLRHICHRLRHTDAEGILRKVMSRRRGNRAHLNPIRLFAPEIHRETLTSLPSGCQLSDSWEAILRAVRTEHPNRRSLHAVIYPCAPLQVLD